MYRIPNEIRSTRNRDGGILLDIRSGNILQLNFSGAVIFEALQQGQNEVQIADRVSKDFGIPYETAETDLREFLKSLEQQHLLDGVAEEERR